jgi:predicted phage terminase large subunit-like protein
MILFDRLKFERTACEESFYTFFLRFWPVISPEKLVANWHIKVLADELQAIGERVIRREKKEYDLVINVPPGTTKSSLCSIAFPAWLWAKDPTLKIMCGSHSYKLSIDLADKCRRLIQSEKYRELFPEVVLSKEGLEEFQTDKGGERLALSVGSAPIGRHAHIHIFDDLLDSKDAAALSETALKSCRTWIMEVMPSRAISKGLTPFVLLMQPLCIGDPTDMVMERANAGGTPIRFICLPAEINNPEIRDLVRPRSLRKEYIGGFLDSVRLNKEVLAVAEVDLGQYAFPAQYLMKRVMPGGGMFKVDQFANRIIAPIDPINYSMIVRYYDKAGTLKGGKFTVGVKMGMRKNGNQLEFHVLDVVRGQWEAAERERMIKTTAQLDGRKVIIGIEQEPGSGGKESAQSSVTNLVGFAVRVDRPVGNKVARADAFATQVNSGNVYLIRGLWNSAYIQELSLFWFGPFSDQVDASSGAFQVLVGRRRVGALPQMPATQAPEQPANAKVVA